MTSARPHDPFAPSLPRFPRTRLLRAGVPEEAVAHLAARWDDQEPPARVAFARSIARSHDDSIVERFTVPDDPKQLDGLRVSELRDLLAARGLHVSGTKADLVAALRKPATPQEPAGAPDPSEDTPDTPAPPQPPAQGDAGDTETPASTDGGPDTNQEA